MQPLDIDGRTYTEAWIRGHAGRLDEFDLPAHARAALTFCGQWLSGAKEFVVRTSGSTGEPKPIRLTRAQMAASARMTADALHLRTGDRALVCLSPEYIAGIMMLARGLELRLRLMVIAPSSHPPKTLEKTTKSLPRFDFTAFVPLQLQTILSEGGRYHPWLNAMKAILVGGGPVSKRLEAGLQALSSPIYHTFGMTETATHFALRPLNGPHASERYQPLPGVRIDVDRRGCLTVRSPILGARTVATNDRITLHPDGSFTWLGRLDHVINTGGVKVQAEGVEAAVAEALTETGDERAFFVGSISDERLGEKVVVILEGREPPATILQQWQAAVEENLGAYERPRAWFFVEKLFRTSTGKIDRGANLRRLPGRNL